MQEGSVIREHRNLGPDVWSYRWWESGPNGNRVHRRIVLGTNRTDRRTLSPYCVSDAVNHPSVERLKPSSAALSFFSYFA
jgi:hypothetical protein